MKWLDDYFGVTAKGSSIQIEVLAGLATFLTMSYIIVVNPTILSKAGMDFGSVFVATVIASAVGTLIMGIWANWPVGLAPGMGLNAFFTFGIVLGMQYPWKVAMGAVFVSGVLFLILGLTGLREWVINSIPQSLKLGIICGIGLFLAVIGFENAGVVIDHPVTLVGMGDLASPPVLLFFIAFAVMGVFDNHKLPGGIVVGILSVSIIGWVTGITPFEGFASSPPSIEPTLFELDISGALTAGLIGVVFTLLFVDFFDSAGTLTGVAHVANKIDKDGNIEGIGRAVVCDSIATIVGALLGTSTATSYIESGAGVKAGGRTGLTAVVIAILFLLCLGFAPLARSIPSYATGAALVFVSTYFIRSIKHMNFDDVSEYAPAMLATFLMPLTFSIANGIAMGFIVYVCIKVFSGRLSETNPAVLLIAAAGLAHFLL